MKKDIYILGISAFYHDSAAVIIKNDFIIAAAQEERFTRIKHFSGFPENAVKFCLEYAGITLNDVDNIVFYDKPFLKFERLLETYYVNSPGGVGSFLAFAPVWMKEKLFVKKVIRDNLSPFFENNQIKKLKILFSEHHLSHASSAFFTSSFRSAAIVTIDGVGEWATATIMKGNGNKITPLKELHFPHSVGLLYSSFTYFLGFRVNSGEYKLMGLAPYGEPDSDTVKDYLDKIKSSIADIKEDGSIFLNMDYFNYATGKTMIKDKKWLSLFGFSRRDEGDPIDQHHCDLALAVQYFLNETVIKMANHAYSLTGSKNLCMAGGVALNCVTNSEIRKKTKFENIWIQPAAGDSGGALGAALASYYIYNKKKRIIKNGTDLMQGCLLGPENNDKSVERELKKLGGKFKYYSDFNELCDTVSGYLANGKVIGWFQGRMEWGPRALGNRSIIADPRKHGMQKKLNLKIKFREDFRPFAPSVLREDCKLYFEDDFDSPYMLFVSKVKKNRRKEVRPEKVKGPPLGKIKIQRSDIPAVTHIDFSSRLQTVDDSTNIRFRKVLEAFKKRTGYGILVNTSFNVRGEPIVCTVKDAYECFMNTHIEYLVTGNFVLKKGDQPHSNNLKKRKFKMD
ncbi:MAG: carbamoyltransferase [Acidobacteriota bacterium]